MPKTINCHSEPDQLTSASNGEITQALAHALQYDAKGKPHRSGSDLVATIAAEWLTERLHTSGFVVLKAPPARQHSTG